MSDHSVPLSWGLIQDAAAVLEGVLAPTPLIESPWLSEVLQTPVFLKCDALQVTGSFKVRGALYRLSRLSPEEAARGVVTASAGNHGLGIAWAARRLGIPAHIALPTGADAAKIAGISRLTPHVTVGPYAGFDETDAHARQLASANQQVFISAFDDPWVMAGNGGSLALELLRQLPEVRTVLTPISGGGLAGGLAVALEHARPEAELVGVQHASCPSWTRSVEQGSAATEMPPFPTLAGGLEGGLGHLPWLALRHRIRRVLLVDERAIWEGVRGMLAEHHLLVEPSSAAVVAAALQAPPLVGPVVVVMTGANLAFSSLQQILQTPSSSGSWKIS